MRVVPNWRFLIPVAAVLAVVAAAVHFTHRWQVGRQTGAFLREADAARDRKDAGREIAYLQRYLRARPGDLDARERLGRQLCAASLSPKQLLEGYLALQDVLRQDGDRDELRRYAASLAMRPQLALYPEAQADIEALLKKRPADGELEELLGNCLVAAGKYDEASAKYHLAYQHQPDRVTAYGSRAVVLRQKLNKPVDADKVIADMVTAGDNRKLLGDNRKLFRTHTILAEYWRLYFRPDQKAAEAAHLVHAAQELPADATVAEAAAQAVVTASKIAPDELDVLLLAADAARERGVILARQRKGEESRQAFDEARKLLGRGVERHPQEPAVYRSQASLESAAGRPAEAVAAVRKGLEAIPDSVELTLTLLDYQILTDDAAGAEATLGRLTSAGLPQAEADYHTARLLVARGRYFEAAGKLEAARRELSKDPAMTREANLLLGRCCLQFGEPDRALAAFNRALPTDPTDPRWVSALEGVAEAEAASGQADAALASYRKLKDRTGGAWPAVARLEMIAALRAPAAERDWRAAEGAVAAAERVLPGSPEVAVLKADLAYFRGKPDEARRVLADARTAHPKAASVWLATAAHFDYGKEEERERAAETLAEAEKAAGDSPELRLAKARLWAVDKKPDLPARLIGLGAGGEAFGRERHCRLLKGLAEVAAAAGAKEAVEGLWEKVAEVAPDDLTARLVQFDRATAAGDDTRMDRVRAEVERIGGETSPSARLVKALQLIWKAQPPRHDRSGLKEAAALLDGLARERAGWTRVTLAQAVVLELQIPEPSAPGYREAVSRAASKYKQAIDGGEANPQAMRKLMVLLAKGGRYTEAQEVFGQLPKSVADTADVQRLAAELSLRTDNRKEAIDLAALAVSDASTDPDDHIWAGQVAAFGGDRAKAEAAFRRAVALRPDSADYRLILLHHLIRAGRKDDAAKEFAAAKEQVAAADRPLFAARVHALLGDADAAAEAFKAARAVRPADPKAAQAEAEFLFHAGRLADALEAFRRALALPGLSAEEAEPVKRMLCICLYAGGDLEAAARELEGLGLAANGVVRPLTGSETPDQQRTRAVAFALQPDRASKEQAIKALEGLGDNLTPVDRFLLAQLYAAANERPKAGRVLSDLVQVAGQEPVYVAYYALWLIREGDLTEAGRMVERFGRLQPDTFQAAELNARLLAARKDLNGARRALREQADGPKKAVAAVARVFEEIDLNDDADVLYRRLWDENKSTRPEVGLTVAAYYGRRGRTDEALRLLDAIRKSVPAPRVGEVAVRVLYAAQTPTKEAMETVAGWLLEAARTSQGDTQAALVGELAAVRNLQKDYDGAADLYRLVLKANPKDALAMNNLAFLLSALEKNHDGVKHDEALALLARARQLTVSQADLDDTEAVVRLNRKEVDKARQLLERVVQQVPSGSAYFHLARAEKALAERDKDRKREMSARVAWDKSVKAGLKRADLHPLEREDYDRMAAEYKMAPEYK